MESITAILPPQATACPICGQGRQWVGAYDWATTVKANYQPQGLPYDCYVAHHTDQADLKRCRQAMRQTTGRLGCRQLSPSASGRAGMGNTGQRCRQGKRRRKR